MKTRRKAGTGAVKQAAARKLTNTKRTAQPARSAARPTPKPTQPTRTPKAARRAKKSASHDTGPTPSNKTLGPQASNAATLAPDCTIAQAIELKSHLAPMLSTPAPVAINLADVRRIDTAGLQVLATFIRERRAAGLEVACEGATESFLVTATLLGLGALFTDDRLSAPAAGHA